MKWLAIGIILLFIGVAVAPSINTGVVTASFDDDLMEGAMQVYSTGIACRDFNARGWSALIEQRYRHMLTRWSLEDLRCIGVDRSSVQDPVTPESESIMLLQAIGTESTGDHPPIFINGNDDFTAENGVSGGSGTAEDPYVIEGWVIVGDGSAKEGIAIVNTSVFFVIRNCTITNRAWFPYLGILLQNVTNGRIVDVEVFKNFDGISIMYCSAIDVERCNSYDNYEGAGFTAESSHHLNFVSCESYRNSYGFLLIGVTDSLIDRCFVYDNDFKGINIWAVEKEFPIRNNTILNSRILRNRYTGICIKTWGKLMLAGMGHTRISGCEIADTFNSSSLGRLGIEFLWTHYNIVENCTIHSNEVGIQFQGSRNNIVRNCTIFSRPLYPNGRRGQGVFIVGDLILPLAWNITVEHCDIYNLSTGIIYWNAVRNIFYKNNIYNNELGVSLFRWPGTIAMNVKLVSNNIFGNTVGLRMERHQFADVRNNWWGSPLGPGRGYLDLRGDPIEITRLGVCLRYPWATEPIPDAGVIRI